MVEAQILTSWRHDFQPCTAMVWDCFFLCYYWDYLILWLFLLHHIQSLANVTMATTACNLLYGENDMWVLMLLWQPELLFAVGLKDVKALLAA
jgi:hypothetical protein